MDLLLHKSTLYKHTKITISGSKSETNRMLLLQALYPNIILENTSTSDDSLVMIAALKSENEVIDIHHAGTAMRFLTAYFCQKDGKRVILTGSDRMKERPIKILVEGLKQLGASIDYLEKEGFPPIEIQGKKLLKNQVVLDANVSSQYISALMLIGSKLEHGIEITLNGEITSLPYLQMTLKLLKELEIESSFEGDKICIFPKIDIAIHKKITIESDWSSASYFYSLVALSEIGTQIELSSYRKNSLQGDCVLAEIYSSFGVETTFFEKQIILKKIKKQTISNLELNLNSAPDIAQTIAVTCFGLGLSCTLTGLHTLKIKETDRLEALKTELSKLGALVVVDAVSLRLQTNNAIKSEISIETYNDHRMAMAFAPLALKTSITIKNAEVVSKSYPAFWIDLEHIGIKNTMN